MSFCFSCRFNVYNHIEFIRKNLKKINIGEYMDKNEIPLCCRPIILTVVFRKDLENKNEKVFTDF